MDASCSLGWGCRAPPTSPEGSEQGLRSDSSGERRRRGKEEQAALRHPDVPGEVDISYNRYMHLTLGTSLLWQWV